MTTSTEWGLNKFDLTGRESGQLTEQEETCIWRTSHAPACAYMCTLVPLLSGEQILSHYLLLYHECIIRKGRVTCICCHKEHGTEHLEIFIGRPLSLCFYCLNSCQPPWLRHHSFSLYNLGYSKRGLGWDKMLQDQHANPSIATLLRDVIYAALIDCI